MMKLQINYYANQDDFDLGIMTVANIDVEDYLQAVEYVLTFPPAFKISNWFYHK